LTSLADVGRAGYAVVEAAASLGIRYCRCLWSMVGTEVVTRGWFRGR
jgi:hypothetical protein